MQKAEIGQKVYYTDTENNTYRGTVKSTQIIDTDYLPAYQRLTMIVDLPIIENGNRSLVSFEGASRFFDYC